MGPAWGVPGLLEEVGCISCCRAIGCPSSVQRLAAGDEAKEGRAPVASKAGEAPRAPPPAATLSLVLGLLTGPR